MNLLEIYLKEIKSVKTYNEDWCENFPNENFVEVTAIWNCYGRVTEETDVFSINEWENIKKRGYRFG